MLCTGCVSPPAEEASLLVQKLPVIDACDSDVATHCLADKGLNTYRVGEIRQCLVGMITPLSPPDSTEKVGPRPACLCLSFQSPAASPADLHHLQCVEDCSHHTIHRSVCEFVDC